MSEELSKELRYKCDVILDSLIDLEALIKGISKLDKREHYDFNTNLGYIKEKLDLLVLKTKEE